MGSIGLTMAIPINDYSMSLAMDDSIVAIARFSGWAGSWTWKT
jgi:hypothetical protein